MFFHFMHSEVLYEISSLTLYRIAGKFSGTIIWRFANSQRLADFNLVEA